MQLWGLVGVQKEAVLASTRSIVTVEEVVDELEPRPNAVVLPGWVIDAVCEVPGGAHPSFAMGYSVRDNDFYQAWDEISRSREGFSTGSTPTSSARSTTRRTGGGWGSTWPCPLARLLPPDRWGT